MKPEEFAEGVKELRRACDLTDTPRQEVMMTWYTHLRAVDAREWKSIVRRMIRTERDGFPRNLVAAVNSYVEPRREAPIDLPALERNAGDDDEARKFFAQIARIGQWGHTSPGFGEEVAG